jgi:DnaJ-class molecular chaperone
MRDAKPSPPCPICHGSGQISTFKGVSRFLLTTEECPHCCGTGQAAVDAKGKTMKRPERKKRRKP